MDDRDPACIVNRGRPDVCRSSHASRSSLIRVRGSLPEGTVLAPYRVERERRRPAPSQIERTTMTVGSKTRSQGPSSFSKGWPSRTQYS